MQISTGRRAWRRALTAGAVASVGLSWLVSPPAEAAAVATVYRSATTAGSASFSPTLKLAKPPGVAAGDVMVARVANRNRVDTTMQAVGWTRVGVTASTGLLKSFVWLKVATASEPSSYTFTLSANAPMTGSIAAFTNVDPVHPLAGFSGKVNGNSSQFTGTPATTDASTSSSLDVGVWFGTQLWTGPSCPSPAVNQPVGFTRRVDTCVADPVNGLLTAVATTRPKSGATQAAWSGSSAFANTNIVQSVVLNHNRSGEATNSFAAASVDVGKVWDGYNADGTKATAIPLSTLDQPSGLAASRVNPRVMYSQSEKDRQTVVAISTTDAAIVGKYKVTVPNVFDTEDIATGPCPAGSCLFVGDVGTARGDPKPNNVMSVVRVTEPSIASGQTSGTLTGDYFPYKFPSGIVVNSESLMVHPTTGEMYVITKNTTGQSDVYKFPHPLPAPGTVSTLAKVGTLTLPILNGKTTSVEITAATIHPNTNRFAVRTYTSVYEFRGTVGGTLTSAIAAQPVALTAPSGEGQGEALDYAPDGRSYYTLSESEAPPYTLKRVDKLPG